jgi:uncharacterized membrane protein YqjE
MATTRSSPGLLDTIQGLAATLGRGLHTRFELIVVDIESERDRLIRRMTMLLLSIFFGAFGVLIGAVSLVLMVDEQYRVAALGGTAGVFLVVALIAWFVMRSDIGRSAGFMASTRDVLNDDVHALASAAGVSTSPRGTP